MTNDERRTNDDVLQVMDDSAMTVQAAGRQSEIADRQSKGPTAQSPILLAIDTCTRRSSVALRDASTLRAECSWESDRHHTAAVSAEIRKLMQSCGIKPEQIGAVA